MLRSTALALFGAATAFAASCDLDNKCPEDSPCCSQYGDCGVGAFCLGGCDPLMSFSLDSCVPAPVCEDKHMKLDSLDRIKDISEYLGDPSKADWVSQGEAVPYRDSLLLTMPKDSVGTVLASTTYMWYGNVKAKLKTARGQGVVTAFILFSDVKDEIDYEWVGVDLETAQTNFYFQGIPNYENSGNLSMSNTFANFHEYEIDWTPDTIEFKVDGQTGRKVKREDTWNSTTNQWEFPQTPARVQLSIWPGGLPSNAKGTIDWAGGEIDWDHEDIQNVGYFYTTFSEVTIECWNADSAPGTNKGKSYWYEDSAGTNDTVIDGDRDTKIASLQATGLDMDKGKKSSGGGKKNDAEETKAMVPGGGSGSTGQDHSEDDGSDSGSDSGSDNSGGGDGGEQNLPPPSPENCDSSSFNQDCRAETDESGDGDGNGNSGAKSEASMLAIVIAACALYWL